MMRSLGRVFCGVAFFCGGGLWAGPFPLSDSAPDTEAFRQRFLASYGVNAAIEPRFEPEDRVLYETVLPHLRDDPERAIALVERALGDSRNPAFRFLLGNLHYELGNFDRARSELDRAIEDFPDFRRAHRTVGLIHIQNQAYPDAIRSWLKVITLGGGDAQSYGLLGYAYLAEKKFQSAVSAYRMARMFKPDSSDFRRGEAQGLMETRQFTEALALFEELIAEQPEVGEYWLFQANIFLQTEQYVDAIANLEVLHGLDGGNADSRFLLGDLHLREDNHRLALRHYTAALEHPGYSDRHHARALQALRHLVDRGLMEEAVAYRARLEPVLPEDLDDRERESLIFVDARIAFEAGDQVAAQRQLETLVARNPLHADALMLLAEIHQREARWDEAIFLFERFRGVTGREADALLGLARLEIERSQWQAALGHLHAARERAPGPSLQRYIESVEAAIRDRQAMSP